jgi:hypothetical protein
MGAAIVTLLFGSGCGLYYFLTLPNSVHLSNNEGYFIMLLTFIFVFSVVGLILWTDQVRDFYRAKHGLIPTLIKIVTFPIWVFGMLLALLGAYGAAKGVRDWSHKSN